MKGTTLFALIALIALSVVADGQNGAALPQLTLYSFHAYNDTSRSSVNFDTGVRGFTVGHSADVDLAYGTLTVNNDNDWFEVRDARSMIVDLGAKQWEDFRETPAFFHGKKPRKPLPLDAPKVVENSAGSKEVSPYQQFVRVRVGHMYLMKVTRGRKKIYVMFRVDSLTQKDNCVLSWKKVPPPTEDLEK